MDNILIDRERAIELLTDTTGLKRIEFWKEVQELVGEN